MHLTPKYFFRSSKSLHLFETHCAFLPRFNPNLDFLQAVTVTKSGHYLLHNRAFKGYGSIPGWTSQTDWHRIKSFYYIKVSGIASGNKLIKRYDILTCEDMISSHVKISMISVISHLSLKLYLNSLVYHRNIFGSPSKVLGNIRKSSDIFENFRKSSKSGWERSSGFRNNFGESSEIFGKSSKMPSPVCLYNKKNITR